MCSSNKTALFRMRVLIDHGRLLTGLSRRLAMHSLGAGDPQSHLVNINRGKQMKQLLPAAATLLSIAFAAPASAGLNVGAQAPDFSTPGIQGSTTLTVDLAVLLKMGPVVIFFFPSVFTGGSTEESHEFADNIDKFRAAGATVVGMSREPIDALARFSIEECAGKFPLAWAGPSIVAGFDVNDNSNFTTRTTYVIAPTGKIAFVHDDEDYRAHVKSSLAFVQGMKR
jgi:peroxiredoxin Q/BCP